MRANEKNIETNIIIQISSRLHLTEKKYSFFSFSFLMEKESWFLLD